MFSNCRMIDLLRSCRPVVAALLLFVVNGCGGESGEVRNEKMSKVSGVVTYNGKPIDAGMVSLSNPTNGYSASGEIGLAGKFDITLVPVGDYRVSISPPMPKEAVEEDSLPETPFDIPVKYQDASTSGLQATVPPEGLLDLKIELE